MKVRRRIRTRKGTSCLGLSGLPPVSGCTGAGRGCARGDDQRVHGRADREPPRDRARPGAAGRCICFGHSSICRISPHACRCGADCRWAAAAEGRARRARLDRAALRRSREHHARDLGHETNYGSYTGDFDLARSLATLAYEGRRRALFTEEFLALLKMVDRGVPRSRLIGSSAGAFGNPQFLPSVYLRVAQDGDGDGFADIWSSRTDTLASIANYFKDAGWRTGEPWGVAVGVPAELDRKALGTGLASPRCPQVFARHSRWKTMREWRALGLAPKPASGRGTTSWPACWNLTAKDKPPIC